MTTDPDRRTASGLRAVPATLLAARNRGLLLDLVVFAVNLLGVTRPTATRASPGSAGSRPRGS